MQKSNGLALWLTLLCHLFSFNICNDLIVLTPKWMVYLSYWLTCIERSRAVKRGLKLCVCVCGGDGGVGEGASSCTIGMWSWLRRKTKYYFKMFQQNRLISWPQCPSLELNFTTTGHILLTMSCRVFIKLYSEGFI